MPTRADVERFADANRNIRTLVLADLERLWRSLDWQNADATRDLLLDAVPLLVTTYGDVAATVAADFYEETRDAARVAGRFTVTPAASVDVDTIASRVRWSVGPLYSANPNPADALGRLGQHVDELTLRQGKETIGLNAGRDPARPRWARVPVGKTCAFCTVLASRGAIYRTEASAKDERWHGKCDCTPTAIFPNEALPEGYNPDALMQQYQDARKEAQSGQLKPILSKLREQQGTN